MRTIHRHSLVLAAFALFAFAANAVAQEKSPALLNALEVRQLIGRTDPADQARLSAHFAALADSYAAEAKRHASMAQDVVGNPSRNLATGLSAHCKRLAELNTQSANTVRELAVHHRMLAAGVPSVAPADSAGFQAGAGAPAPNQQELAKLAETARTPADHRALEAYFLALAERHTKDVADHTAFARAYRGLPRGDATAQAVHCDRLVTLSREAAKEATAAAAMHKEMAGAGR